MCALERALDSGDGKTGTAENGMSEHMSEVSLQRVLHRGQAAMNESNHIRFRKAEFFIDLLASHRDAHLELPFFLYSASHCSAVPKSLVHACSGKWEAQA
jgi:hypothetical protein